MVVKQIEKCRICGNTQLTPVIDLGNQMLSGVFPRVNGEDPISAPLGLVKCDGLQGCGLLQLHHSVPLNMMYGEGYGYLSGMNQTMSNHLRDIALTIQQIVPLRKDDVVLDIGSNDGTLLKSYTAKGIQRIGVDPGGEQFKKFYPKEITLLIDFFSNKAVRTLIPTQKLKVITSIAMFYDLEEPMKFISEIKELLYPEGIWVFEQSYMPTMIEQNAFDTICHEHLEYYAMKQIIWMLARNNLRVFDVKFNDTNGGSFQVYACHDNASFPDGSALVKRILDKEMADGYDTLLPFQDFNKRISMIRSTLYDFLKKEKEKNKTIHLYGASTKGNVLLQYCHLDHRIIAAAADKNPSKMGHWTPGTHIPIFQEEYSRDKKPDYFLVLPWHFRKEFLNREKEYLDAGGCFIFPLPEIELVKKNTSQKLQVSTTC